MLAGSTERTGSSYGDGSLQHHYASLLLPQSLIPMISSGWKFLAKAIDLPYVVSDSLHSCIQIQTGEAYTPTGLHPVPHIPGMLQPANSRAHFSVLT